MLFLLNKKFRTGGMQKVRGQIRFWGLFIALTILMTGVFGACRRQEQISSEPDQSEGKAEGSGESMTDPAESYVTKAMYIQSADQVYEGQSLFIDVDQGTPFYAPLPEDALYDEEDNLLAADEVCPGNIFDLYGNGIMLESYPGQYPGITKGERVSEGQPEDVDQYADVLEPLTVEPDPSDPASMDIEYTTESAAVTMASGLGSYTWNYTDENGESQSVIACGSHILQWEEIPEITDPSVTDILLRFTSQPAEVTAVCWPVEEKDSSREAELLEGETVAADKQPDGKYAVSGLKPGYIYLVTAVWENDSEVEYGFCTALEN